MNWQSILIVATTLTAIVVVIFRVEPHVRGWLTLLLLLPTGTLLGRWAAYRPAWPELGAACLLAGPAVTFWWLAIGRRLPPAQGSTIRVWRRDDEP